MAGPRSRSVNVSGLSALTLVNKVSVLQKVAIVLDDLEKGRVDYKSYLFVM